MAFTYLYGEDIHTKMCKKIAQLTKVIYNLNSKAEEHEDIIDSLKKEHENNINKIMQDSQNKILKFKQQSVECRNREKEFHDMSLLLQEIESENKRLQASLEKHVETSKLNEENLCSDYENKLLDMQNKFLERKREYEELHDSFKLFQNDLINSKQGKITNLTVKHHKELEKQKQKYEIDLTKAEGKQKDLQEELNKLQSKLEAQKEQFWNEQNELKQDYESKTSKLKAFYEKELEYATSHHKNEGEEKFYKEKQALKEDFERKKIELNNRTRFLEKQSLDYEEQVEEYEKKYKKLHSQYLSQTERLTIAEGDLAEKEKLIESLQFSLVVSREKLELFEKNSDTTKNDVLHKEEQLNQLQLSLKTKISEVEELNQKNEILRNHLTELETGLSTLKRKYLKEKEAKVESFQSVETGQKLCKQKEETIARLQNEIAKLEDKLVSQKQTLTSKHEEAVKTEQRKHMENIETFKKESEHILKESQTLLLTEFHRNQEEITKKHVSELNTTEVKRHSMQTQLDEKFLEVKSLQQSIEQYEKKLEDKATYIDGFRDKIANLQNKLDTSNLKINKYENILNELKAGASDEKKKFFDEQNKIEKQFVQQLENDRKRLATEYEEKIKTLQTSHRQKEELLRKENKCTVEKLTFQLQHEIEVLQDNKEKEISLCMIEVQELKEKLEAYSFKQLTEQKERLEVLTKEFENEKKKLEEKYNFQLAALKNEFQGKLKDQEMSWHIDKKSELELLVKTHEKAILEIENSHVVAINALKSHLMSEKQKETTNLQEDFNKQKESLHEFFRLQTDEQVKQLSSEFENQIHELKNDIHREKELRLKEFSVHTAKIAELSKSLEERKEQGTTLKKNLDIRENEIHTIRKELESKVGEILQIRRECNSRMRCHEEELSTTYTDGMEELKAGHLNELRHKMAEWRQKESELDDQISSLKIMLNESEDRFEQRPSRDQDIQLICELQEKILQQEVLCQRLNEEKKHFKLELVNREENFNKVFSSNPNVGFMNPIEVSRRKSLKKR